MINVGTWNQNDPCFDWKGPCFWRVEAQKQRTNRFQVNMPIFHGCYAKFMCKKFQAATEKAEFNLSMEEAGVFTDCGFPRGKFPSTWSPRKPIGSMGRNVIYLPT